jgi:hypothetical protein
MISAPPDLDQQARLETALAFINEDATRFRPDFAYWLRANWKVWAIFEREADRLWRKGRKHYAARTIIEWLRHESNVSEADITFKLNNNFIPDLARLYARIYPQRAHFFELRHQAGSIQRAA